MNFYSSKNVSKYVKEDERGMGVVEVAIIVIILIGLAILFKGSIESVLNSLLDSMSVDSIIS